MPKKTNDCESRSISIPKAIEVQALKRAQELGFGNSFSAYVLWLVEKDLETAQPAKKLRRTHRSQAVIEEVARILKETAANLTAKK